MYTLIKVFVFGVLILTAKANAQTRNYLKALVNYDDYKLLVDLVERERVNRLVDLETFLKMSTEPDTIILDTRSDIRYWRMHVKGAKHLSFTDFTQDNLNKIIPDFKTRILIYCNNNFRSEKKEVTAEFVSKVSWKFDNNSNPNKKKPRMMALNVPTYISLYGYGYQNVYELDELVDVTDPRISFEGTIVESR